MQKNRTRRVDEDFNRLWAEGVLEDATRKKTSEFLRANEVKSMISEADYLLDIHSMQKPCVPLMMAGMLVKGVEFAKSVDMSMPIISDTGHKEGMRMRDYLGFSRKESAKNALLVECGQHWEKLSEKIAIETSNQESLGELQMKIFESLVETKLQQPHFITHYPIEASPLARRNDVNPNISDRFELLSVKCGG